ncbi:hypothetical protein [Castellaniella sp. MT123]|uniref:hypothetical protein n=1 Tax=Castellaniella sp. MT123 TaxID=3140381 RepID=UPI0031F3FAAB
MESERPVRMDEPLIELLLRRAAQNGHSLVRLSSEIGISYQRLVQYRRGEARLASARRLTLENIGAYLQIPVVLVLLMAGSIGMRDLTWPGEAERHRVAMALALMRQDIHVGPLVPGGLEGASAEVQHFVVFLYEQLVGVRCGGESAYMKEWTNMLAQLSAHP